MHGLILNLSLPFWQVQPGNHVLATQLHQQPPSEPRFNRISLLYNLSQKVSSAGGLPARAFRRPYSTRFPAPAPASPGSSPFCPPAPAVQVSAARKATRGPGSPSSGPSPARSPQASAMLGTPRCAADRLLPFLRGQPSPYKALRVSFFSRIPAAPPARLRTRFPAGRGLPRCDFARQNFPPRVFTCPLIANTPSWRTPVTPGCGSSCQFGPTFQLGNLHFTEPHTRFQVSGRDFPTGKNIWQEKIAFSRPGIFALGNFRFFPTRGRFGEGLACEKCEKARISWGGPLRRACLIFFALFHGEKFFDMRFQVSGSDFRAGKNLVGKSASNCVSRGCWFYSARESVRFQGRRVRERASVGALMFCGGILLASAPLGLSRCFWALGSGERACESVLECKRESE
ncbi:Hypothetical_protein [Hexamita inflata]|uniref:Hypothetical_protein n=1 Tax=Hexamita inflata TaxID=28002 RepID=A0AA86RVH2_9EUKA|nr:Hypothetical protein HINF_LOCUS66264 [Hexamita inflata]